EGGALERGAAVRARPGRRRRRLRRVLPAPRRARGVRAPAGSGRLDGEPPADVPVDGGGGRRGRRRRRRRVRRRPVVTSYYGRPVVKEPVWTWEIPTYFFTGGLAGASSVLSLCAKL